MIENKKNIKIREIIKSSLENRKSKSNNIKQLIKTSFENTNKKNIELKKLISSSIKLDRYLQTLEYISKNKKVKYE